MALKLYNSLTKKKQLFKSLKKNQVKLYTCGPTVYDYAHIGNLWSYLTADVLRRYLEFLGFQVKHVKNITDVGHFTDDEEVEPTGEDKIEKAARREKKTPLEIARYYTRYYLKDEAKLNIKKPHVQPRPTQEIPQIIKIIQDLIKKKYAYETSDGVYFNVKHFQAYGKLSGNTLNKIQAGARVQINENKKNPADFALWIKRVGKNKKHTLHWPSPWGQGFPGWHIECTAMATKYLGGSIDIHTGGEDNIFPHHECEIAQSQAYTGKKFVRFWIHTRHFYLDNQKMSKSLKNIYTLSKTPSNKYPSLEQRGYQPLAFRLLKLQSHYRSKANFSFKALDQASKNLQKINQLYQELRDFPQTNNPKPKQTGAKAKSINVRSYLKKFIQALNQDLNTPLAVSVLLDLVKNTNKTIKNQTLSNPKQVLATLEKLDQVFAILTKTSKSKQVIPRNIKKLAQKREQARQQKKFKLADQLRDKIIAQGYKIIDTSKGSKIKTKNL
ncbi:MAG: cysteine--tRNA ligase [Candidatus Moranbacteria bacterium]|nr:cysteine--tRNA ligase [Candidatus Moranbacteria bacterium]